MSIDKKWAYYEYRDELRYYGNGSNAFIHIDIDDVELIIDENGEIVDLTVYNASKYFTKEEIKKIAKIYPKKEFQPTKN